MAGYAARQAAAARERGDEARAAYWDRIAEKVDQAPPLAGEVRDRLAVLLRPTVADRPDVPARARAA